MLLVVCTFLSSYIFFFVLCSFVNYVISDNRMFVNIYFEKNIKK